MRYWTFWEWVAYGSLFVAALIITADTSFKLAPDVMARLPEFFHSEWWGFTPAMFVIMATIILLLREFVFSNNPRRKYMWNNTLPHIKVFGRKFINERVVLDGGIFRDCHFQNVTFVFNGTEPIEFTNNHITGSINLATDNPAVVTTILWLKGIGALAEKVKLILPPGTKVASPTIDPSL